MVDAGVAALSIATFFSVCTLLIFIAAYRNAVRRGAGRQERVYMLIGMIFAIPFCFGFWSVIAIFSIWFATNVVGVGQ